VTALLSVEKLHAAYGDAQVLWDVDLVLEAGEIGALLGPNGAGKTTTLRMVMNILAPDSGTIDVLGRPADGAARDRIGYMPEERGLYPRMVLEEQLVFFAQIKGAARAEASQRVGTWLERMGLADWRKRKLGELSKGMQQKAQLVATLLHDPEILIMDEPMSGLDPVATNLIRDVLQELSHQGKTLVLSSHQMETVERVCDAIALINRGEKILEGSVAEVKGRHASNTVVLAFEGDGAFLETLPEVSKVSDFGRYVEIRMADGSDVQSLLRVCAERLRVRRFEIVEPSLHDIFVQQVTSHEDGK